MQYSPWPLHFWHSHPNGHPILDPRKQCCGQLWSVEALKIREEYPNAKPRNHFRVEHGTPRRHFARLVLELYEQQELTQERLNALVGRYWKLAVISLEEDKRLNKIARSKMYDTPEERWAAASIEFPG